MLYDSTFVDIVACFLVILEFIRVIFMLDLGMRDLSIRSLAINILWSFIINAD